jgi:hypothetical protein
MIAVTRQHTAERINAVVNDPSVRPWVANDSDAIDLTERVADRNNILLMGEHGGCMFYPLLPGIYEVHTQVARPGRGDWTRRLTEACAEWMFTRTPCYEIMTRVPHGHIAARAAAVAAGMRFEFTRPLECRFRNHMTDVHVYSYRIQDWIGQADAMIEVGRAFHDMLHRGAARLGVEGAHPDDDNHNRYVGAAIQMVWHGQPIKAVNFYNRWAQVSRHEAIALLSLPTDPTVMVKIDHGLCITLRNGEFEVTRHAG